VRSGIWLVVSITSVLPSQRPTGSPCQSRMPAPGPGSPPRGPPPRQPRPALSKVEGPSMLHRSPHFSGQMLP
jgi:hypothetical protein